MTALENYLEGSLDHVRVATWNLYTSKKSNAALEAMTDVIVKHKIDILCVQESFRTRTIESMCDMLSNKTQIIWKYKAVDVSSMLTNGILTYLPINDPCKELFCKHPKIEDRAMITANIDVSTKIKNKVQ